MRAAAKGIVHQRDIAWGKIESLANGAHGHRHGAEMHGHVIAHRHRVAVRVVNRAGVVAPLFDVCGIGRLAKNDAHFFGDGGQQVTKKLELDRA